MLCLDMRTLLAAVLAAVVPLAVSAQPEDVNGLLGAIPKLGAGDYALGMDRDEAFARMQSSGMFNGGVIQPKISFSFSQLPEQHFFAASTGAADHGKDGNEAVALIYTTYPTTPVVSGILRKLDYGDEKAPNVATTVAALRTKYGPESEVANNLMSWFFDKFGHLVSADHVAKLKLADCFRWDFIGSASSIGSLADQRVVVRKIGMGYARSHGGSNTNSFTRPIGDICLGVIYLHAALTVHERGGGQGNWGTIRYFANAKELARLGDHVVASVTVFILDTPLDYAASEASHGVVLAGGARH